MRDLTQRTIKSQVFFSGVSLHAGETTNVILSPAEHWLKGIGLL